MILNNFYKELTNEEIITKSQYERIIKKYNSFTQLLNVACGIYKWKNLSDDKVENNIMSVNIERAMMTAGFCSWVNVMGKWYPLPFTPSTVPDLDFRPTAGICIGYNGTTYKVSSLDAPILKNTPFGWSILPAVVDYSDRLETIDTTTMGIVNAMQVPFLIRTPDGDSKLEVVNELSNALITHRPIVIKDSAVATAFDKAITVLNTNVDSDGLSKLTSYRSECVAQFMRYLGIVDMTGEKRERLLVDEVNLSSESGKMLANPFEISRDENAKLLSEFFHREITYEKNTEQIRYGEEKKYYGNTQSEEMGRNLG